MKKCFSLVAVVAALFFGFTASSAHAAYVADGDFSAPYAGGSFTTYNNATSFGPWNVVSGSVDLIGGYWQSPSAGINKGSVDMDGNGPGSISQTLSTIGAGSFILHFSLSANPDGGLGTKFLQVSVGDAVQNFSYTLTGANTHANMNYLTQSLAFNTTGPTNLVFSSLSSSGPFGAVIGNVSISAVPLPAGIALFFSGLASLFGFKRFGRKKAIAA